MFWQICSCDESDCSTCQAEKEAVLSATAWFDSKTYTANYENFAKVDPSQSMICIAEMQLPSDTSNDQR